MAAKNVSFFHLHLVSDSTGETLITVARAAAAQYASVVPVEHVYPAVRTSKQLDRVLTSIEAEPGITLYTLLDETLVERLEAKCTELGLPCRSILGPVLRVFQAYLGTASNQKVGAQHILNAEYFKRIDALNYTMLHDDGQHTDDLEGADVVLVGVSRTSRLQPRSTLPIAASGPPTFRWSLVQRCHRPSRHCARRSWSVFLRARNESYKSAKIACSGSTCSVTTTSTSTGRLSRRRWPSRAGCARATTGR